MKTTFIFKITGSVMILILSFNLANAQFVKGTLLAETDFGDIGFRNNNYNYKANDTLYAKSEGGNFNFYLYPKLGIFLTDKLAVGTGLEIYFYKSSSTGYDGDGIKTNENKSDNTSFGLFPFARYYFNASSDGKSMFFGQVSGGVYFDLSNNSDSKYFDASGAVTGTYVYDYKKYNNLSGNILFGWNRFISQNVAVNLNLGYQFSKSSRTYSYTSTWGGISTISDEYKYSYGSSGITWSMGFTMFIPCKKADK